jgi:multiple sugar transport system permease protein
LAGYPTVGYAADTIVSYLTDVGSVKYEMGYASALSVMLFVMMFGTRSIIVKLLKKVGQ